MSALLHAEQVSFGYGKTLVLRCVSVSLEAKQVVALLGPNGSGKSTLIRVMLGQLHGEGDVRWEGRSIRSWTPRQLAREVAYLPQNPTWLDEQRVIDVLRLGRAPHWQAFGLESGRDEAVLRETVKLLDLGDILSRRLDELSGGQRQRVFVGRCLAQEPRALLLDEPSTFLDLRHQVELGRLLRRLASEKGLGILMASHDLNLATAFADELVLLSNGVVAARGSPADVFRPDLLEQVYGVAVECIPVSEGRRIVVPRV